MAVPSGGELDLLQNIKYITKITVHFLSGHLSAAEYSENVHILTIVNKNTI